MKKLKIIFVLCTLLISFCKTQAQGIEIYSAASILVNGTATIEITNGNFVNNGTYTKGTENLIFSGTSNGNISGSSNNDFYNLTVNNSNGVTQAGSGYVAINNLLTFSQGLFNTGSNYITINNNATISGASTTKYINGNCRKVGNDAFIFPIGGNGKYAPIAISAPGNIADHFTAAYFKANPNSLHDALLLDVGLNKISSVEYWVLNRTNGNSNVRVTLSWDITSYVAQLSDLRVVRWLNDKWIDKGNSPTTGNISLGTITSSSNASSFSAVYDNLFTLGSSTSENPLPVDLLNFKTECSNSKVNINWSTASEINCDYYIVEKMNKDNSFTIIANVSGNGNTNQVSNYQIDDNNSNGIAYYRLTQVDYNGQINVFNDNITVSNCNDLLNETEMTLFENDGEIYMLFKSNSDEISTIKIFDLSGKQIVSVSKLLTTGQNKITAIDFNLASGMYLINIQTLNNRKSAKMIVR